MNSYRSFTYLIVFAMIFWQAPIAGSAWTPASACAVEADTADGQLDADTGPLFEADDPKMRANALTESVKSYNSHLASVKKYCLTGDPNRPYVIAMLNTSRAWILHYQDASDADVALNLAIQQLTACASHYFGTNKGAICETWQQKAIKWQQDWTAK